MKALPKVTGRDLDALLRWSLNEVSRGKCQSQDKLVVKPFPGGSQNNMQHFLAQLAIDFYGAVLL